MLLIKNGRVMDPKTGFDQITDLLVEGKKILKIGQGLQADDAKVIDASGYHPKKFVHWLDVSSV